MKASVVICTYGRPEAAKRLLMELNKQGYKDFEVLLVCQGDKDDLEKITDSLKTFYPLRCFYEATANLPHGRNVGIKEAAADIIIFLDDDTMPADGLIEAHVVNYAEPSVGIVGGRALEDKYEEDVSDFKVGKVRRLDGFAHTGFYKDTKRQVMHVRGVNFSTRKGIIQEVGGFDERFEGTAEYEDMDFCLRVLKRGYKIIFDPTAVVEHLSLPFGGCRVEKKEEVVYWLYRNHSLAFLKNFNKLTYPVLIAEYILRVILRSILWRNAKIIRSGIRGIRDGWRAYLSKPQ